MIVGEAVVRVRVLSSGLSRDIANNVRSGFRGASGDFDREGRAAGQRLGRAAAEGAGDRDSTGRMRKAGRSIGSIFSDGLDNGFRDVFKRRVVPAMTNSVREGTRRAFSNVNNDVERSFNFKRLGRIGNKVAGEFHKSFNLGIGAARMGPAIIGALALAAPSVLSGIGSLGVAMGAQLVSSIAASGPAIAGALGFLTAGVATAALNFGLLYAAFKSGNEELDNAVKGFGEVGKALGQPIAAGMVAGVQSLVASLKGVIPQISDLLSKSGEAFGRVAQRIGEVVARADNLSRIRGILETNNSFIDKFGAGLAGLTSSFLILFNAVKPFVDAMGDGISKFGQWAERSLAAAEANGTLASFMQTLVDKFKSGADTIGDFTVGLYNVFRAAAAGAGSIGDLAERFRAWTSDATNQDRLVTFFEKMHVLSGGLGKLFGQLASSAAGAMEKMDPAPMLAVFDIIGTKIGPAIAELWNQVQSGAGENLVRIFDNLGTMLQKIANSGSFEKIAGFISGLLAAASDFLASDLGSTIAGWLIPLALFGGTLTSLVGPIQAIVGLFSGLGLAGAGVVAAVAAVAAVLVLAWQNSENFRDAITNLVEIVGGEFTGVWDRIAPKLQEIWTKFVELTGIIGDRLAPVISALTPIVQAVVHVMIAAVELFISIISGMIDIVSGVLTGEWSQVWDGAKQIVVGFWEYLQSIFGGIASWLGGIFVSAWNAVYSATSSALGAVRDFITGIWNGIFSFLEGVWNGISSAASSIWNGIASFFSGLWNGVSSIFSAAWSGITSALAAAWNAVASVASAIWGGIVLFFSALWNGVASFFSAAWNTIFTMLVGIWNAIFQGLTTAFTPMVTYISKIWDKVAAIFSAVWGAISAALSVVWSGIATIAITVWTGIAAFLSVVWNGVRAAASAVWNVISTMIVGTWTFIQSIATAIWNGISSFLSSVWNVISSVARSVWNGITTAISATIMAVGNFIRAGWSAVSSFLSGLWNGIKGVASSIWNAITSAISATINAARSVITSIWNGIASVLSSIWSGISSAASSIWGAIVGIASSIWNAVVNAIVSVVDPLVGTLQGIWESISSAISNAWGNVAGAVRAIWEGISNAITGPIGEAIGAVQAIISTIIGIVQGAWETISGIVSSITGALSAAKSAVASAASLQVPLPSVKLQGIAGGYKPPGAATGGIFSPTPGGTTIRVAEANKMERVEPLDASGLSNRDRAIIKELSSGGSAPVYVQVQIGEQQLTDIVDYRVRQGVNAVARSIKNGRRQ